MTRVDRPADCVHAEDVVSLALGALPPAEAAAAEAHVAACAPCRAEFAATKRLAAASRAASAFEPSAGGEARLLAAFRAERADVVDGPGRTPPPPATKRRGVAKILSMALPLAAAATVLVALVVSSRAYRAEFVRGDGELVAVGETAGAATNLDPSVHAAFTFAEGDEILAGRSASATGQCASTTEPSASMTGRSELTVRLALEPRDGAASADMPSGTLEMRLHPGARVRRGGVDDVELVAGAMDVAAAPLARPFTVRGGRGAAYALIKGTRFTATTAEDRLVVVVREGTVEIGRRDGPSYALNAGEQGLVDGARLLHAPASGDAFLTPRAALVRGTGPLEFEATLAVGDGGPVSLVGFDDAYPNFVVRVHAAGAPDREIKLQRSMLTESAPPAVQGGTFRLGEASPYRLRFSLKDVGLPPGRHDAVLRYMSYRRHGDGAEWLGVVESGPTSFEVPSK